MYGPVIECYRLPRDPGVMQVRTWLEDGSTHTFHAASMDDRSDVKATYPRGYDSRCGWCYLNADHTVDAHTKSVAE